MPASRQARAKAYWRGNLRIMAVLLTCWFLVSFGCGILWVDWLNQYHLFGFPLGFWFAQQGAMVAFVLLIAVYVVWMNRLDRRLGFSEDEPSVDEDAEASS